MTTHQQAHKDYLNGMKYKDIAEKYNVSLATVKSWKTRYGWSRDKTKKSMHTKNKSMHTKKRGGQPGNHNALYNNGGAPSQNQNAVKHGLLAKYLPKEMLDIVMDVEDASPVEILYANIKVQFARIIRAQNLMYVKGAEDHTSISKSKTEVTVDPAKGTTRSVSKSEEIITSIEKETMFMKAQSMAMSTLSKMIRQYEEMCRSPLATEEQKARIEKLRKEAENITISNGDSDVDMTEYVNALNGPADEVWSDENGVEES